MTDSIDLTPALSEGEGAIYNLAGQQVKSQSSTTLYGLPRGIYIVDGKKVVRWPLSVETRKRKDKYVRELKSITKRNNGKGFLWLKQRFTDYVHGG